MRKAIYQAERKESLELLRRASVMHVATTAQDGAPIFRTVHGVVLDGFFAFHGAPAGEKMEALGRPAIVAAEEVVAEIPSYFLDPERACPATTYYRSVQVRGRLEPVENPASKARVLQALMTKYQPEGGHVPIDPHHPLYRKAIRGLLIVQVRLEHLSGKAKLGQNRRPEDLTRILELLWQRGATDDVRAIELIREANPSVPTPRFFASPPGTRLRCDPGASCVDGAVQLVERESWNRGIERQVLRASHLGSSAWVVAKDDHDALVATARGLSDGGQIGWIFDVAVAARWRKRGLGTAVMRTLLDHPRMREVRQIRVAARDAQEFYRRFGFTATEQVVPPPRPSEMVLARASSVAEAPVPR